MNLIIAILLNVGAAIPSTVLYAQVPMQATGPLGDGKADLADWSRGTTILIDGMRDVLQNYRQKLAGRLMVCP
jgi:hypothetical protein